MLGKKGSDLFKDFCPGSDYMPCFDKDAFEEVRQQLKSHYKESEDNMSFYLSCSNTQFLPNNYVLDIFIKKTSAVQNKRCILAFMYNRLQRLRKMRWELGSVLPPQVKINLSDNELIWFKDYSKLLMSYMGKIGDDMGLNITHDVKPPKTFYIEIKCKIDFGKLQLDSGKIIALKRNSVYHMQRSQCEILVRRGIAEHVG